MHEYQQPQSGTEPAATPLPSPRQPDLSSQLRNLPSCHRLAGGLSSGFSEAKTAFSVLIRGLEASEMRNTATPHGRLQELVTPLRRCLTHGDSEDTLLSGADDSREATNGVGDEKPRKFRTRRPQGSFRPSGGSDTMGTWATGDDPHAKARSCVMSRLMVEVSSAADMRARATSDRHARAVDVVLNGHGNYPPGTGLFSFRNPVALADNVFVRDADARRTRGPLAMACRGQGGRGQRSQHPGRMTTDLPRAGRLNECRRRWQGVEALA